MMPCNFSSLPPRSSGTAWSSAHFSAEVATPPRDRFAGRDNGVGLFHQERKRLVGGGHIGDFE
jgi:hypothetical protein